MSLLIVVALFCAGQSSMAQLVGEAPIPPHPNNAIPYYDFEWVTINRPGNVAYDGRFEPPHGPFSKTKGRGSVPYIYRVSQVELTSAQYIEFLNTFSVQSDELNNLLSGVAAGGFHPDPLYSGPGNRYLLDKRIPNAGMIPVRDIAWRTAARYCNWLHNNKSSDPSALANGAYDTSTFGNYPDNQFFDQVTRSPGARFWIPSLDEWLKAVHFDPNRFGQNKPGWWKYPYGSDVQPVPGLPGVGETSAGFDDVFLSLEFPLKGYPDSRTPWGLWDASGGMEEWTEEIEQSSSGFLLGRVVEGMSFRTSQKFDEDHIDKNDCSHPQSSGGFRLVGAVQPRADMDGDLFVDGADLAYLLQRWGTNDAGADMNGDGLVTGADLGLMLGAWGR